MTIRLSNVIPLLLVTTMSAVVSFLIFLFVHKYVSEGKSLKFLSKAEQVSKVMKGLLDLVTH